MTLPPRGHDLNPRGHDLNPRSHVHTINNQQCKPTKCSEGGKTYRQKCTHNPPTQKCTPVMYSNIQAEMHPCKVFKYGDGTGAFKRAFPVYFLDCLEFCKHEGEC